MATATATSSADGSGVDFSDSISTPTYTYGANGFNFSRVEQEFIRLLNEERRSRGLQPVEQRDELTEMGASHAQNMAKHGYIGHTQPDGTTIQDRYEARGLLPECRLPVEDSDRFYQGAENAHAGYAHRQMRIYGDDETIYIGDETDIARYSFEAWMNSEEHREAMLLPSADEAGLGIAFAEDSFKYYVALELC